MKNSQSNKAGGVFPTCSGLFFDNASLCRSQSLRFFGVRLKIVWPGYLPKADERSSGSAWIRVDPSIWDAYPLRLCIMKHRNCRLLKLFQVPGDIWLHVSQALVT